MEKIIVLLLLCAFSLTTFAQQTVVKKVNKVKKTSTLGQKGHNTFHKHKHYNGYKTKHITKK